MTTDHASVYVHKWEQSVRISVHAWSVYCVIMVESNMVVIFKNHFPMIRSLLFDTITGIKVGSSFEPQERMRKKVRTMFDPSTSTSIRFLCTLMY